MFCMFHLLGCRRRHVPQPSVLKVGVLIAAWRMGTGANGFWPHLVFSQPRGKPPLIQRLALEVRPRRLWQRNQAAKNLLSGKFVVVLERCSNVLKEANAKTRIGL